MPRLAHPPTAPTPQLNERTADVPASRRRRPDERPTRPAPTPPIRHHAARGTTPRRAAGHPGYGVALARLLGFAALAAAFALIAWAWLVAIPR